MKNIESMIFVIRGQKVMLDFDLAELYSVETKALNQSVSRNIERFPADFMFQLSNDEWRHLRSQFVTFNSVKSRKYMPYAFTENGVAMLSGILKSKQAIAVNIAIMRTFTKMRRLLQSDESLIDKIQALESGTHKLYKAVFERLDEIEAALSEINTQNNPSKKRKIGFHSLKL